MIQRPGQRFYHPLFLLAPGLILLGLFVAWPLVRAVTWSFGDVSILNPNQINPVGLDNYSWMLSDPRFRQAFANTAMFALMVVPAQTILAFFMAMWVNRRERAWRWLRTVFFIPIIVSMPVLAILWTMMYQPAEGSQMGLINQAIQLFGVEPQRWLQDPLLALPAIAFMSVWQGVGFQMMIFLAGLQNLSKDQLEAAQIDGAGAINRLRHVIIPGMKHSIIFVVITTTILAFRLFVQPYLMTRGGPEDSTVSIVQMIYELTFLNRDLGLASAATIMFLLLVAAITIVHRTLEWRKSL